MELIGKVIKHLTPYDYDLNVMSRMVAGVGGGVISFTVAVRTPGGYHKVLLKFRNCGSCEVSFSRAFFTTMPNKVLGNFAQLREIKELLKGILLPEVPLTWVSTSKSREKLYLRWIKDSGFTRVERSRY